MFIVFVMVSSNRQHNMEMGLINNLVPSERESHIADIEQIVKRPGQF